MDLIRIYECLCDETRLRMLNLLAVGPLCVGHFQDVLKEPQVKVSKHLAYLRSRGLVTSSREGNWVVYRLPENAPPELVHNLKCLQDCVQTHAVFKQDIQRLQALLPISDGPLPACNQPPTQRQSRLRPPYKTLFICSRNSARSIMAEYLLRSLAGDRFEAHSAGSAPVGAVHPMAIRVLRDAFGIDASAARSKSWKEDQLTGFDFVITVCDRARETCITLPGQPVTAHWTFRDPAAYRGTEAEKKDFFFRIAASIRARLLLFINLPVEQLGQLAVEQEVRRLGLMPRDFALALNH